MLQTEAQRGVLRGRAGTQLTGPQVTQHEQGALNLNGAEGLGPFLAPLASPAYAQPHFCISESLQQDRRPSPPRV